MKFLIDANLSPVVASLLLNAGHDVVHVRDVNLQAASDSVVLATAASQDRVLVSADTDFTTILARERLRRPSLLLIRRSSGRRSQALAEILTDVISEVAGELERGSVVVVEDTRLRIRTLPIF
jgi:predicted nuclease of predicted toxin-antitoxin system